MFLLGILWSGVLSQTADTAVKVWSDLLPQLLSLAVFLGVTVYVASTKVKTYTRLKGWYGLKGGSGFEVKS
jgi:hypothetical protein